MKQFNKFMPWVSSKNQLVQIFEQFLSERTRKKNEIENKIK